jgi:branched-chain amino acid transport system ATP-binding protein
MTQKSLKLIWERRTPVLEIKNLFVSYGKIQILRDICLRVNPREIVAIVGANASGKTTLLRSISGLLEVASGRITFLDTEITRMRPDTLVSFGICQVPEGRHIFPKLSVFNNLEMGAYLRSKGEFRREFHRNIDYVFRLFPILAQRKKQKAGTMSGGEQQMLAIARALMSGPKLLMLDEPSVGLAPLIVRQIFKTIKELNAEGLTILLVEQEVEASLSISDRGYVLQLGHLVLEGLGSEILGTEQVKAIYLGKKSAQA